MDGPEAREGDSIDQGKEKRVSGRVQAIIKIMVNISAGVSYQNERKKPATGVLLTDEGAATLMHSFDG